MFQTIDDDFGRGEQAYVHAGGAGAVADVKENVVNLMLAAIINLSIIRPVKDT